MKIAFYFGKFITAQVGGAERSLAELMNEMSRRGHDVTVIVREPEARIDQKPFYELHQAVKVRNLCRWHKEKNIDLGEILERGKLRGVRSRLAPIQRFIRKRLGAISLSDVLKELQPDVVVVFLVHHFSFVNKNMRDLDIPLMLCHRNDPEAKIQELRAEGRKKLRGLDDAYARAKLIAVQMEAYRAGLPADIQEKTVVIPNACTTAPYIALPAHEGNANVILSVGRLAGVKNHALLVNAFAKIARQHPDWSLEIYGDGPERGALEATIAAAGLQKRIHLKGTVKNIDDAYRRADIFAFPSHYEGFSRALTEAMAHELPTVCLQDCTFSREVTMMSDGGILTGNDVDSYVVALETLMLDANLRREMGQRGSKYIRAFTPKVIYDAWEAAFIDAAH